MKNRDIITQEISYKKNGKVHIIKCEGNGLYDGHKIGGYRYKLEIDITSISDNKSKKENKTLACIMMNPSTTFPDKDWEDPNWKHNLGFEKFNKKPVKTLGFDSTVINVLKMAASKSYSKVYIFNLFPYIHPTGKFAIQNYKNHQKKNEEVIEKWNTNNCDKVLVAWGSHIAKKSEKEAYNKLKDKYIKLFNKKRIKPAYYEWNCNNGNNCPYHPSRQVNSCWTKNKDGKIEKKKKNDGKPGIIQQFIDNTDDFIIWENYPQK